MSAVYASILDFPVVNHSNDDSQSDHTNISDFAATCIIIVSLFVLSFKMKGGSDFWGIKNEIKYMGIASVFALMLFAFSVLNGELILPRRTKWFIDFISQITALSIVNIFAISVPLFKAERENQD
jgi:hypothetical protein